MTELTHLARKVRSHSEEFDSGDSTDDVVRALLEDRLSELAELEQKRRQVREDVGIELDEAELSEYLDMEAEHEQKSEAVRERQKKLKKQRRS